MTQLPDAALDALRQMLRIGSDRSAQEQALHRLHCVCLVACGRSCSEVAAWFGDSPRSLQRWVRHFRGAAITPVAERPPGRPPRLTGVKSLEVAAELRIPPGGCGYAKGRWDGKLLQQHLREHHGVCLSLRQCQRTLHDVLAKPAPPSA
ncbi:helix-turn-helix domain-containing protein [Roseateles sp. P5_E1]